MLAYDNYHRRLFVDVKHETAKARRKVAVGKIRAMLWRAGRVRQDADDQEVWNAHETLYRDVIQYLGSQMETDSDFHPELQKLGLSKKRIDPANLEGRLR